ncbi:mannonate dehydratase [Acrasis kona]|uniref:Mannonate dehydratase n=1 Tax=Acrasis kona TaxID=1008807 RepID=A0AAW2YQE2_9EUKA
MTEEGTNQIGNNFKYVVDCSLPALATHMRVLGVDTLYDPTFSRNYILFLARRDHRIIVTQSTKLRSMVELILFNRERKRLKITEYQELYESALDRENNRTQERLFEHEKSRIKHLSSGQILERIEMMKEEVAMDDEDWFEYKGRHEQLRELVDKLKLVFILDRAFDHCTKCNGKLIRIDDKSQVVGEVENNVYNNNKNFSRCGDCGMLTWGTMPNRDQDSFQKAIRFCEKYSFKQT